MSLRHQPKAALINDFSGFGRCSVTVALPIIGSVLSGADLRFF